MILKMWEMDAEAGTVDGIGCPRQDGDADGLSSSLFVWQVTHKLG